MSTATSASLLDSARLRTLLGAAGDRFALETLAECPSTNSLLLERALRSAVPENTLLVADRQTAGRGRMGRHWSSSAEGSLTFSLSWRFTGPPAKLSGLSLAVGLAVARGLDACGASRITLKWPNDIVLDGGKVGGILIELEAVADGMLAVIGIGLNLQLPAGDPGDFLHPPAALAQVLPVPDRHQVLAQVLLSLTEVLDHFAVSGFAVLRDDWQSRHAWQDRPVRLLNGGTFDRQG
ncbi:MAG TPA: biotin--[acetyl-CoA-carboxylase] ligase, partial [Accumulibacter sp.]|nr:biotin--[acetyl-CoA-carboxylase] ligase [Accumulibacter sp.]